MKKLLDLHVITKYLRPTSAGREMNLFHTYTALAEMGHRVNFYTSRVEYEENFHPNIKIYLLSGWSYLFMPWKIMPCISKPNQILCIHGVEYIPDIFLLIMLAFKKMQNKVIPIIIFSSHGYFSNRLNFQKSKLSKIKILIDKFVSKYLLNNLIDTYRTLSQWEANHMQKIGISKKINVIPNGLAKEALLSTTKILNNQTNNRNRKLKNDYILSIGRLDRIKNYETVINAMPKINKTISYLIMGPIEDQKYHRELVVNIHKKKLNDRVRFIGVHSGINKYRFLRNATALIHPSKSEGFGNVVYEALSQQTIPVVSSNTATAELIKNKYNGFVIDSSDSLKLAEIINSLINKTNSSEIKKIKHNIKKSFHAQSWSNVAKKLERLYISTFNTKFEITN